MTQLDDYGNPIPDEMLEFIEQDSAIPEDLKFPFMTSKFSDSAKKTKTEWLLDYLVFRNIEPRPGEKEFNQFFAKSRVDGSDEINRFRGSLLGLAIGDALGTTLEFKKRGTFTPITGMQGGGPFKLNKGEWTDDTSMMYCLAHSLVRKNTFDAKDQMELYRLWWKQGVFSVNGTCFDIGNTVREALVSFEKTGAPYSGPTSESSAGNGSLMRLAPIPMMYFDNFELAVEFAAKSSQTTHGATEAVDACRYYSALIWGALHGASKKNLLSGLYSPIEGYWEKHPLCPAVEDIALNAAYKEKSASQIKASGYVIHSLEAALWAFSKHRDFASGALAAVNLGEDADTTGAIYGQLAGAFYGEKSLPVEWINDLALKHVFYLKAGELLECVRNSLKLAVDPSALSAENAKLV